MTTYGFEDGFSNVMYLVQRLVGNDMHERAPWLNDIKVYPFTNSLQAFRDVDLAAGDIYESCFFITLPQVIPALMLVIFVLYAQLLLIVIFVRAIILASLAIRDVRNTAVYFGQYNEEMKLAYERQFQGLQR